MKLKIIAIIFVSIISCAGYAAEPNTVEAKQVELAEAIDNLGPARVQLRDKLYSGTIEEVLAERIVDINSVKQQAEQVKVRAVELAELTGLDVNRQDYLKSVVESARRKKIELKGLGKVSDSNDIGSYKSPLQPKVKMDDPDYDSEIDIMKRNAEIKHFVEIIEDDPNYLPDVNDPNYLAEYQRHMEFKAIVWEICKDS